MSIDTTLAHKVARAELMKRILIVVIAVIVTANQVTMFLLLNAAGDTIGAVRETQTAGSPILRAIAEQQDDIEAAVRASTALNEAVLPCFDPDSKCAKEAAAAEAARAGANLAAIVATTYCRDQVMAETYTYPELLACVGSRINGTKDAKP